MQTIGGLVRDCFESFDSVLSDRTGHEKKAEERLALSKISDQQGKFKVWTGNTGAHRKGASSLDYRLRDASNLRNEIKILLEDLLEALGDARMIFDGEMKPWDEDEPDGFLSDDHDQQPCREDDGFNFETELDQLIADIDEVVNYLYRVSAGLRNAPQHDRLMASPLINTSYYEPFDIQHVLDKHPNLEDAIVQRLGKAITMRRHYFKYRELHRGKLGSGLQTGDMGTDGKSTIASSLPDALKIGVSAPAHLNVDDNSESGFTQTSHATSVADPTKLQVPPLPKEATTQEYFECPFCFMILSAQTKRAWKRHVFADLRPYMCLYKDCPTPTQVFARRRQWVEHIRQQHWRMWKCPFDNLNQFKSEQELAAHFRQYHPSAIGPDHIETFVTACERPSLAFFSQKCSFCEELLSSSHQFQRHIGRHLEQLALFSLPTNYDTDDAGEQEGAETVSSHTDIREASDPGLRLEFDSYQSQSGSSDTDLVGKSDKPLREETVHHIDEEQLLNRAREEEEEPFPFVTDTSSPGHECSRIGPALNTNTGSTSVDGELDDLEGFGSSSEYTHGWAESDSEAGYGNRGRRPGPREKSHGPSREPERDTHEHTLEHEENEQFEVNKRGRLYKQKMRKQLVKSGLSDKEIDAILAGKKVEKGKENVACQHNVPTYTKMARRHLSLETLRAYGVDYELDRDPEYVLVKRWVPESEQDMLWRHTQIIRQERKMIMVEKNAGNRSRNIVPEFEWVNKKERRRSKSPSLLMYLAGGKPA